MKTLATEPNQRAGIELPNVVQPQKKEVRFTDSNANSADEGVELPQHEEIEVALPDNKQAKDPAKAPSERSLSSKSLKGE